MRCVGNADFMRKVAQCFLTFIFLGDNDLQNTHIEEINRIFQLVRRETGMQKTVLHRYIIREYNDMFK